MNNRGSKRKGRLRNIKAFSFLLAFGMLLSFNVPAFAWQSDNGDGTFTNPILNADYPDISAIRVGSDFYMVSSTFVSFPSVPIMHSKDLVNWEIIGYVTANLDGTGKSYTLTNTFEDYGHGSWAPTIAYRNGTYYVGYYQAQGKFIMFTATNPAGPYTKTVFSQGFHDPGLFIDDDGTGYIISEANDVKISKLSADYKSVVSSTVATRIEGVTGSYLVEGTHVMKRNGYYYIFRNSTPPESYTYLLRSKNIYGPYEMRILLNGPTIPGGAQIHQGGPIDTPTGEWWFYAFQDGNGLGRRDILIPMQWQNDWPILGDPATVRNVTIGGISYPMGSVPVTYRKPNVGSTYPIMTIPNTDEFYSSSLGVQWQWNHYPDNTRWSLSERSGYLRLHAKNANSLWRATNTLTQRVEGPDSQGTIELDTTNMLDGDNAGLSLLNIPYGWIGVTKSGGVKRIVATINAKEDAAGTVATGPILNSNLVYLRANADLLTNKATFSYSTDNVNFIQLGGQLNMPFDLGFFQGDKFGIFNYTTAASGGYVDVNWFRFHTSASGNGGGNGSSGSGTTYEAETGTSLTNSIVETLNTGYIGNGYVNFNAATDASVQWNNIYCAITGTKNVKFRYALASGTRNLDVYVNGTKVVSNAAFTATGGWTTWAEKTIQVPMNSGTNTLRVATTGTEGPNIDSINVSAQ
ncbi:beta-xylosidase [Paenibacillus sp. CCS19]|uniref:family 43 glycosylhydrolase n=1 Tax=Paenibacillus sp. CCS19 TaxID=3158387 RepID=UPI00255F9046|nr:family 43 glycosylhydrolase [Paenibacillus cellulosilyticus]GMK37578.1 beta-xylosidase [Paenibacillus cellulosilyticus]